MATVPRLLGWDKDRVTNRVNELLELVGLDPRDYGRRFPHELSGGERQRVGVARALGADPPVLLMDEPFAAVDPVTRQRLQNQFLDLQAELNKTIVFVTHDLEEAAKLGDRIAVLSKGRCSSSSTHPKRSSVIPPPRSSPNSSDRIGGFDGWPSCTSVSTTWPTLPWSGPRRPWPKPGQRPCPTEGPAVTDVDSRWAVVVGEDGVLQGWVPLDPDLEGQVIDRLTRFAVEVPLGSSMRTALAEMLQHDVSWIPVAEHGRYLGVLTPDGLHAAMRRSVGGQAVES